MQEPFECYNMSDIEAGLGLKRKHLIAISLLVGNDHDMNGVRGVGLDTALHFVQAFNEDDILYRYKSVRAQYIHITRYFYILQNIPLRWDKLLESPVENFNITDSS